MMVQNFPSNNKVSIEASECIDGIRSGLSESAFGFKIQALASHVLLRLGYKIDQINSSGHPDIVAHKDGTTYCFEIEAEIGTKRLRNLTEADFKSLIEPRGIVGYYALAVSIPTPHWLLVSAPKLIPRIRGSPKALIEALSDKTVSEAWTYEYGRLLCKAYRQIKLASFKTLSERALAGQGM